MFRSLNEIEQTVRKAVRGRGLPWGIADEAGKAVRCLHQLEFEVTGQLIRVLDEADVGEVSDPLSAYRDGAWQSKSGKLSPLLAGPSLCDFMDFGGVPRVEMSHVVCPVLLAGFLANAVSEGRNAIRLSWPGVSLEISCNRIGIHGNAEGLEARLEDHVVCEHIAGLDRLPGSARTGQVWVDDAAWTRLEQYAKRTYVEGTEASRAGAGAGLLDND